MPPAHHHGRGDPHAEVDGLLGHQGLEGGGTHGGEHRRPELQCEHPGAQTEPGFRHRDRAEGREGLLPDHLGGPEGVEAEVGGVVGRLDPGREAEGPEAGEGHTERAVVLRHAATVPEDLCWGIHLCEELVTRRGSVTARG